MATSYRGPEFKRLQREWDEKLRKNGFDDIEDRNSPREFLKRWHNSCFRLAWSKHKEEYYQKASAFLNWFVFPSPVFREIWFRHAEGMTLREIAKDPIEGKRFSKDGIHKIVRELQKTMLVWAAPNEPMVAPEPSFSDDKKRGKK